MEKNYAEIFESLVEQTAEYLVKNNLKAQILGISGGIDSTVVAAICHEVSKRTGIPLIGRSLPTKFNKEGEVTTADLVGNAFCNDFEVYSLSDIWEDVENSFMRYESKTPTPISSGNIQARLRMIYLYNIASLHGGLVMDTDNLTENNLGYFTIHGDVGDFNPIGGLWKTEVFKLAEWLISYYRTNSIKTMEKSGLVDYSEWEEAVNADSIIYAIEESLKLKPTAGLGITNNDLEEIGADNWLQVDSILQEILAWKWLAAQRNNVFESTWDMRNAFLEEQQMLDTPIEVIIAVTDRHFRSEFKRKQLPIKL